MKVYVWLRSIVAVIGGLLGWFLGGFDGILWVLVAFVVTDYLTGVAHAIASHALSSAVGFRGIARKVTIFLLVGIGSLLDRYVIGSGQTVRTVTISFYLANEGISIMENAARLGLPVPEKLRSILAQLKDGDDQ